MEPVVVIQLGRQHGHKRQRDEARECHCGRKGDTELAEYVPDVSGHEGYRENYGDQYQRRRDHRKTDLATAIDGGEQRRLLAFYAADDILQDHDRVIDHEPYREYEAE